MRKSYGSIAKSTRQRYGRVRRAVIRRPVISASIVVGAGLIAGVLVGLVTHLRRRPQRVLPFWPQG
jgi:hypothetical protein